MLGKIRDIANAFHSKMRYGSYLLVYLNNCMFEIDNIDLQSEAISNV